MQSETDTTGPMDETRKRTLISLLNALIPASADGKMPGAGEVGLGDAEPAWLDGVLDFFGREAESQFGHEFHDLPPVEQAKLVEQFKRREFRLFNQLVTEMVQCYYVNGAVRMGLGMEARAPFPDGYYVPEGDLALLEPVFERGQIYRE